MLNNEMRVATAEYDYDGGMVAVVAIAPGVVSQQRLDRWTADAAHMLANVAIDQTRLAAITEPGS